MTKLDHLDTASDAVQARSTAEVCGLLDESDKRPTLSCIWIIDLVSGRPVCFWTTEAVGE